MMCKATKNTNIINIIICTNSLTSHKESHREKKFNPTAYCKIIKKNIATV